MFLSRFDNKVDAKGRVSVPASWRPFLTSDMFKGVVVYPSPKSAAVEGCSLERMMHLSESIDSLNPFSEEYDALANAILSASYQLSFDADGRIMLPKPILELAGIGSMATFAGRGKTFQIWNPDDFDKVLSQGADRAREEAAKLQLRNGSGGGAGKGAADD